MSVSVRDVLLKAAEDVQSGMWCKGSWFNEAEVSLTMFFDGNGEDSIVAAQASHRCAQGSIALATRLLGGRESDFDAAEQAVDLRLVGDGYACGLIAFNDSCLPDDPFEAGQQLAELFRQTADSL